MLMTLSQYAKTKSLTPERVRQLCNDGLIEYTLIGNRKFIDNTAIIKPTGKKRGRPTQNEVVK